MFSKRKIAAYQNISWLSHKVKALGVWLATIREDTITLKYEETKETILKTIENRHFMSINCRKKIVPIKSILAWLIVSAP